MKMRSYIYLAVVLILPANCIFATNEEQEIKDVLVEIIKKQYVNDGISGENTVENQQLIPKTTTEKLGMSEQKGASVVKVRAERPYSFTSQERFNFSDFNFTITHNQAVVRFIVNHQMKSAFLEKTGDEWKLVVIADLPEMLF